MRIEKKQLVGDIGKMLEQSSFVYMVTYKGLKVKEFNELRGEVIKCGAKCNVLKNKLVKKAAELKGIGAFSKLVMAEDTAFITGSGDAGAVAKLLHDIGKKNDRVRVKGGCLDGVALSKADVEAIASLPPKPVLYAQLLGVLQAPATNLVSLLNAKLSGLVNVLNSYKNKLEENK